MSAGNCEYCPLTHTDEPCALCGHLHLHERCKADEGSGRCGCCCYMTAAQAEENADGYATLDSPPVRTPDELDGLRALHAEYQQAIAAYQRARREQDDERTWAAYEAMREKANAWYSEIYAQTPRGRRA